MRTDVKLGIVVGLFIAVVAVVYFVVVGGDETPLPPEDQAPLSQQGEAPDTNLLEPAPEPDTPRRTAPRTSWREDEAVTIRLREPDRTTGQEDEPTAETTAPEPEPAEATAEVEPADAEQPDETPVAVRPSWRDFDARPTVASPTPGRERTYTVQENDAGFWGVAAKVYGDGSKWPLIARANPDAESTRLRVGQTLRIPAVEDSAAATPRPSADASGSETDGRTYVVQAGDAGFWGIAAKVYGNGALWPNIARANPDVDSTALQVGQRLVIPELTEADRPYFEEYAGE